MDRVLKIVIVTVIFLLFVPGMASAAKNDFSLSNLVILEDNPINENSDGSVAVVLGSAEINADIKGSIIVVFGKTTINGNVDGDIVSAFGEVHIAKDSIINGNLVSVGKLNREQAVTIKGTKFTLGVDFISLFKSNGIIINALIISALIILAAGLILISIFPGRFRSMSYSMDAELSRRMVLGGLVVIGLTIILAFLIFLIVAPALYILFLMLADIIGSIYLGRFIFRNNYDRSAIYLEFFVGHILISIVKIVPLIIIPSGSYTALLAYGICFIIAEWTLASFGVGTVIDTGFGKKSLLVKKE